MTKAIKTYLLHKKNGSVEGQKKGRQGKNRKPREENIMRKWERKREDIRKDG